MYQTKIYYLIFFRLSPTFNNNSQVNGECIPMTDRQRSAENARRSRSRREEARTDNETRTRKQVVKMLVAVVVLFAICWSPLLIDNVFTSYGLLPRVKSGLFKHMNTAFQLMAYFNR